eukprot:2128265-Pyramimonas_sp.AAC.2
MGSNRVCHRLTGPDNQLARRIDPARDITSSKMGSRGESRGVGSVAAETLCPRGMGKASTVLHQRSEEIDGLQPTTWVHEREPHGIIIEWAVVDYATTLDLSGNRWVLELSGGPTCGNLKYNWPDRKRIIKHRKDGRGV